MIILVNSFLEKKCCSHLLNDKCINNVNKLKSEFKKPEYKKYKKG